MIKKGSVEQFNIYFSTKNFEYEWFAFDKNGREIAFGDFEYSGGP